MSDERLLEIINRYNFTYAMITKDRRELASFCGFVTAKTRQACIHTETLRQVERLHSEGLLE